MERLVPTWDLLSGLPLRHGALVPVERVIHQRKIAVEFGAGALRHVVLQDLIEHAVRSAANGVASEMAKIAALQPDGALLIIAGLCLKPGVVGVARLPGDRSNPAGQCLSERRIVNIADLRLHPEYRLPSLYADHGVVSTVNVPIMLSTGPFGILEIDAVQPRSFDELDLSFLIGIAGTIGEGVARVRREAALNEQLSAREILMREHHHRVRNQYQALTGVLGRHAREVRSPASRERFMEVEHRVFALASLYDHMLGADATGTVLLQDYVESLCASLREFYAMEGRKVSLDFRRTGEIPVGIDLASTLGLVINELVANSIEHAFRNRGGEILVCVAPDPSGGTRVVVSDSGSGYEPNASESIGMTTARRLLDQIGASIALSRERGTTWEIRVPAASLGY